MKINKQESLNEGGLLPFQGLRFIPVLIIIIAGLILSGTLFTVVRHWKDNHIQTDFVDRARNTATVLQRELDRIQEVVASVGSFFNASEKVERNEFHAFVANELANHPAIQALEWAPRVKGSERAAFEKAMQEDVVFDFTIRERGVKSEVVVAAQRDEYFPIQYVEPFVTNEAALGYDLGSDPVRRAALRRARDYGRPTATGRLDLVQEQEQSYGLLVLQPVYASGLPLDTVEARRQLLVGFSVGVFRLPEIVKHALQDMSHREMVIRLLDNSADEGERLLYPHESFPGTEAVVPRTEDGVFQAAFPLTLAGRNWTLLAGPGETFSHVHGYDEAWWVLAGSLLFTLLLAVYLFSAITRSARIERLANDLRSANEALISEIQERLAVEENLRESKERYRQMAETIQEVFWLFDGETQRMIYVSPAYEDVWGRSVQNLYDQYEEWSESIHPDDRAYAEESFARILDTGGGESREYRIVRPDGMVRWVSDRGFAIRGDDGGITRIVGIAQDITVRKETEERLKKSEERYRTLFEESPISLWEEDFSGVKAFLDNLKESGVEDFESYFKAHPEAVKECVDKVRVLRVNKATVELFQAEDEAQILSGLGPFFSDDTYENFSKQLTEIAAGRRDYESEEVGQTLNGEPLHLIIRWSVPLEFQDTLESALVTVVDVTRRKKMEDKLLQSRKLDSLGVLAGGLAHDFNNLLTAIMGNISLARIYVKEEDEIGQVLLEAERASLRAQELTQQLLTFSKGGAPILRQASMATVIRESARFALRGSNVTWEVDLPQDLWTVEIDEGQMSQVINNLIINADQAMAGGGTVRVTGKNIELQGHGPLALPEGPYVRICIQDEGVGIPREHLPSVFDPYFSTKQKGSGLGLSSVYSIVKKHKGHVSVQSEVGRGTTFTIVIPAIRKTAEEERQTQSSLSLPGKGRILVMDDERSVLSVAQAMLSKLGYEVVTANGGDAAITLYRRALKAKEPFDAVIMDLTIPGGMGGREAVVELRQIDRNLKAIVSSGYSDDPVMADLRSHGFDALLSKPYGLEQMSQVLHHLLCREEKSTRPIETTGDPRRL
ncbi:MAG: CHASE domain-containing protein [bacterium]|nr:CHASE domain-containing protein [bacterium]